MTNDIQARNPMRSRPCSMRGSKWSWMPWPSRWRRVRSGIRRGSSSPAARFHPPRLEPASCPNTRCSNWHASTAPCTGHRAWCGCIGGCCSVPDMERARRTCCPYVNPFEVRPRSYAIARTPPGRQTFFRPRWNPTRIYPNRRSTGGRPIWWDYRTRRPSCPCG